MIYDYDNKYCKDTGEKWELTYGNIISTYRYKTCVRNICIVSLFHDLDIIPTEPDLNIKCDHGHNMNCDITSVSTGMCHTKS